MTTLTASPARCVLGPNIARSQFFDDLRILSEDLTDTERLRCAMTERLRATIQLSDPDGDELKGLSRAQLTAEGARRGFVGIAARVEAIARLEREAERELQAKLDGTPYGAYAEENRGINMKGLSRLLGAIGDPNWNTLYDRPRTFEELKRYVGVTPGQRRIKEQRGMWNHEAKMRLFLVTKGAIMHRHPELKALHEYEKEKRRARVEAGEMTPWQSERTAYRVVGQAILRDLWEMNL